MDHTTERHTSMTFGVQGGTPPCVKLSFERKGDHFYGQAEVPTRSRMLVFKAAIPLIDIRNEVKAFLAAQPSDVSGDPVIRANIGAVVNHVAKIRAKRRLGVAIKLARGGMIDTHDIAGPAYYAQALSDKAAHRALVNRYGHEIGTSIFKKIGKGFGTVGKGIGKGIVATGKGVGKGVSAVAKNPLTAALISVVPGGAAATGIVNALNRGSPGAAQAVLDVSNAAAAGNSIAQESLNALKSAAGGGSKTLLIGGGLAAAGVLALIAMRK